MAEYKYQFSPSNLNTFNHCPAQWNYRYLVKPKGIPLETPHIDLGELAHTAIEKYFARAKTKPERKIEIEQPIDLCFEEVVGNRFSSTPNIQRKLRSVIKNFKEFELIRAAKWKTYLPTFIEKDLRDKDFRGIVDFYSEPQATVIDWKTGYKQDITSADIIQGEVYRHLLTESGYPVNKVFFVSLSSGKCLEIPKQPPGFLELQLSSVKDSISNDAFPARPNSWCYNCSYQIECEFDNTNLWESENIGI